ncbi:sensor histidine kinase [Nocardioides daeguensis]|uniref:sensor histidine kinase n=1 Tax=Nocardioides daeguensis TaxID=908359 RepID=UPI001C473039|nr:sensor histidine kinase [Nocardioides daeguensis]MBV6728667.1 sensor histidine kinase [Nocardioides daeguensis]MCR1773724.1 sensor histidine kinase [Nocardioides daeguensis]
MAGPHRQPWRLGPGGERWFDLGLTGFLLLPVLPYAFFVDVTDSLLMLAQITPLVARRRRPVAVFTLVAVATAVQPLVTDNPLWSQLAFPVAVYSVARYAGSRWAAAALGTGVLGAGIAAVDWLRGFGAAMLTAENVLAYSVTIALFVVVAWTLGTLGRTRQAYVDALVERGERLEREASQQAALAAIEERHRIAREMHDVVAHGLTTIVVQADGARAAAAHDPSVTGPALATIATTGREAIAELRRMLGLLRADEAPTAPQPRLADLPTLLAEARGAGTPVVGDLPPDLPVVSDGVALTTYRIVQEALSNVRKHAGPDATASVALRVEAEAVVVEVADDGRGAAAHDDGRGLGLAGMRERVAAHGGTLTTGPAAGGGFAVCARIPL